jgi:Ni/Co efflux regulator RcnB
MRKALIGILLAATAAIPAAAQAQEAQTERQQRAAQRYERLEQRNQQRYEQRQQRQEVRTQSSEQAPVARPQRSEQAPVVREQRQQRGDGGGWRRAPQEQSAPAADWGQRAQRNAAERRQAPQAQTQQQQRQGWGGRGGRDGNWQGRERAPSQTDQVWQGDRNDPRMEEHRRRYERLERQNQREWQRGERRDDRRDWGNDRNDRRWDRSGWRNDNRYDWQRWRYSNRNIYRQPTYYAPYRNYRYSRFSIGLIIDRMFWDQRYWIGDPWQYRLPDPGPGYQWVRYYNDVILVDTWSGEVVDVIYDFFW